MEAEKEDIRFLALKILCQSERLGALSSNLGRIHPMIFSSSMSTRLEVMRACRILCDCGGIEGNIVSLLRSETDEESEAALLTLSKTTKRVTVRMVEGLIRFIPKHNTTVETILRSSAEDAVLALNELANHIKGKPAILGVVSKLVSKQPNPHITGILLDYLKANEKVESLTTIAQVLVRTMDEVKQRCSNRSTARRRNTPFPVEALFGVRVPHRVTLGNRGAVEGEAKQGGFGQNRLNSHQLGDVVLEAGFNAGALVHCWSKGRGFLN